MSEDRWNRATQTVDEVPPEEPKTVDARPPKASRFDRPVADRYREVGELGRGGMGRVFEAHDATLDRPVAIKQSLADDAHALARFEREARITAQLQHPGIVPIFDVGRDPDGRPFYIMRKVEGRPLADVIADATTIEARLAIVPRVLAAVEAVAYAHARRVIHRDIKSWNVLLGPFGETLVIDWGIARELDSSSDDGGTSISLGSTAPLTRVGQMFGTPGFMPPEQARGETVDRRADVFSLGAMLFHVLTGELPPEGAAVTRVATMLEGVDAPELTAITRKAMAIDPADRYVDAGEVAEELRRFTAGKLVTAHRYSTRELIGRWVRKHRIAVTIGSLAIIAVAIVGAISIRSVIDERDRADRARHDADAAFRAEAARADELLVERADGLVDADPTHAIALLKQLRPESAVWARATAVIDSAVVRGVARGRVVHPSSRIVRVIAGADGTVASSGDDGIWIHDAALRKPSRMLAKLRGVVDLAWIDRTTLAAQTVDGIFRVASDGTVRALDAGGPMAAMIAGHGRVFAIDGERILRELDPDGGKPRRELGRAFAPTRLPTGFAYATDQLVIFEPDNGKPIVLGPVTPGGVVGGFAAPLRGGRIAAVELGVRVVEWVVDSTAATLTHEWKLPVVAVAYAGTRLYAAQLDGAAWLLPNGKLGALPHLPTAIPAAITSDCVIAKAARELWLICGGDPIRIGGKVERLSSAAVVGNLVVAATASGDLLSWDLERLRPAYVPARSSVVPHDFGLGRLWFDEGELVAIDPSGARTAFGAAALHCLGSKHGVLRFHGDTPSPISNERPKRIEIIDAALQRTVVATDAAATCRQDVEQIALIFADRVEVRATAAPDRVVRSIPGAARAVALHGHWLAIQHADALVRIDLESGSQVTVPLTAENWIGVALDGRVAVLRDRALAIWDGAKTTEIAVPTHTMLYVTFDHFVVITKDKSLVVVGPDQVARTYQTRDIVQPTFAADRPVIAFGDLDGGATVLDLETGARRRFPVTATRVSLAPDGSALLTSDGTQLASWKLAADASDQHARLLELTNATVAPGSNRLDWK